MRGGTPKGRRPATPKCSKLEVEQRLSNIEERLRMGLTPAEIINELTGRCNQFCTAKPCPRHLGIGKRQAQKYLTKVTDRFRNAASAHDTVMRDQVMALQFRCYQGAFAKGQYGTASVILMNIARLSGILDPAPNQQIIQLLANIPSDRDRFPADTNYQVQSLLRDIALSMAARGDRSAAATAASIAANLTELYGSARSGLSRDIEEKLAQKIRSHLITSEHLPDGPLEPIERRDATGRLLPAVDDFANLETAAKPKEDKG